MKKLFTNNPVLLEILEENGIELVVTNNMDIVVNDDDVGRIHAIVDEYAPAAFMDYYFESL